MRRFLILFSIVFAVSCKHKHTDLSSDAPIKPNEFVAAFEVLENGFVASDSNIAKIADTVNINTKLLSRFIPDTLVNRLMGIDKKTTFHPVGRVVKLNEVYLVLLSIKNRKPTVTAIVLDKKNNFLASKDLFKAQDNSEGYHYTISINREPTFFISREKMVNEKDVKYTKLGWAYSSKNFIVVMKESNERSDKLTPIINPIDTFARENIYSGNYVEDDRNYISIRDGRTTQDYLFFLHIDKNDGNCVGELKGEMNLKDSTHATYSFSGDPCVIDFTFDRNIITIKEKGSCGNRRGMNCFFDDAYTKKKEAKKKSKPTAPKTPINTGTQMLFTPDKKTVPLKPKVIKPKKAAVTETKTEENPYTN